MTTPPGVTRAAWIAVAILWVVAVLNYTDRLVIASVRGPIVAEVPMTEAQFGLLTTGFLWVYGLASPLCGFLADRFSRRSVIFVSLFLWSGVTALTAQMHSFHGLLWSRALMGLSEACYIPAALALITDYHRGATRSKATGLHNSGVYVGIILGGAGGYAAEAWGWRMSFTILGAIGVGYALFLMACLHDAPRPAELPTGNEAAPKHSVELRELFGRPSFYLLMIVNVLVSIANWTLYGWLPTYLAENFKLGIGAAGLSAGLYVQVASFVGIMVGGAWADRWSRRHPRARSWVAAIGYAAAAPALFLAASSSAFAVAAGSLVLFGLGRGFFDANLMPVTREFVGERYAATAYGGLNAAGCLAGGAMTYLGGALRDAHLGLALALKAGAFGLLVAAALLLVLKSPRQARATTAP